MWFFSLLVHMCVWVWLCIPVYINPTCSVCYLCVYVFRADQWILANQLLCSLMGKTMSSLNTSLLFKVFASIWLCQETGALIFTSVPLYLAWLWDKEIAEKCWVTHCQLLKSSLTNNQDESPNRSKQVFILADKSSIWYQSPWDAFHSRLFMAYIVCPPCPGSNMGHWSLWCSPRVPGSSSGCFTFPSGQLPGQLCWHHIMGLHQFVGWPHPTSPPPHLLTPSPPGGWASLGFSTLRGQKSKVLNSLED